MTHHNVGAAANACSEVAARGIDHAAVDGDAATLFVVEVAADGCCISATCDTDGALVDDEHSHVRGADARLAVVAALNDQRARAFNGQAVALAQFDALLGIERSRTKIQHNVAVDGDAVFYGHVFMYTIDTFLHFRHITGYGSSLCHVDGGKGHCADVGGFGSNSHSVFTLRSNSFRSVGIVFTLLEHRAVGSGDKGREREAGTLHELIINLHAANRTKRVVFIAINSCQVLVDFILGGWRGDVNLRTLVAGQVVHGNEVALGNARLVGSVPAGEGVVQHTWGHAGGFHERVFDDGLVIHGPSDEATAADGAVGGGKGAVEDASIDSDVVVLSAKCGHESTVGAVALLAAVDGHRRAAILDGQCTVRLAHQSGTLHGAGVYLASHMQILDGGILHVAERGTVVLGKRRGCQAFREGQRVLVAVEGALKRVSIACTHHISHADVAT